MQRRPKNYTISREVQSADEKWTLLIRSSNLTFSPPTDVIELEDRILVIVEIGGVRSSDLDITLLDRHLIVSGFRERPQHPNPAYHQVEIAYGEFRLEIGLPWAVDREGVSAIYETGMLQIELPRKSATSIRIVEINNGE